MLSSNQRKLLLSSGLSILPLLLATATPVLAQEAPAPALPDKAKNDDSTDKEIIVTGSRIRRSNFDTASPINIYTRDDRILSGARSTSEVLQSSSVTSGTSQINGSFLGFVSEGGPAADTVGLRGLGASRTLVLLNGRRLAPAGTGSQLVAADLNVLPNAIVQRIEVLKEGASSVYGSDAIAGVINIITDTKVNGITFDGYTDQPVEHGGGGRNYRLSVVAGKEFERGHITASFEYRERTGLRVGDRDEFSCPRDLVFSPTTGAEVGAIDPATGKLSCFPYALSSGVGTASGYGIGINFNNGATNRLTFNNGDINTLRTVNGITRVSPSPTQLNEHITSPLRTYTGYLNGAYELGMLGDAEIYTDALFTHRESHQDAINQINITASQLSPAIEIYGGSYGGVPLSAYGYPTSPFFPNALANAGYNYFTPFIIPDKLSTSTQRVDFVRANAGLRGSLGFGDWRYDGNVQYSHTSASYSLKLIEANRLSNALQTVRAPAGTPANLITIALPGQAAAGQSFTCKSNVGVNGAIIAGASCVPLNMYDPSILIGGHIPDNVYNYLYQNEVGHTKFTQTTISLNADGTLFKLPAGAAKLAVGYEHRHDSLDDEPSLAAQQGSLYNFSSAGITKGSDSVDELYGELDVPLLRDKPFMRSVNLNLSGRYTHYRSYGSDFTYHINGTWEVVPALRLRGNYGSSFRAPNLYEQFVANQTGFFGGGVDPCSGFGTTFAPGTARYQNCLAALTPILGANSVNYIATAGPKVITEGGAGRLKAETSKSYGFGMVLSTPPHAAFGDLSFAIDYWNVKVKGEVNLLSNLILDRCYDSSNFATNEYCALIAPRLATGGQKGTLTSFQNPYLNIALQGASGVDFDLRYSNQIAGGKFVFRAQATRNIHQNFQQFDADPLVDYNGTLGIAGAGAGPKWVADTDIEWTVPKGNVTFHYGLKYVGSQDSTDDVGPVTLGLGVGPVNTIFRAEPYWEHGISIQCKIRDNGRDLGQVTFGVNNLTNSHPPMISQVAATANEFSRIGNYLNSSNYDYNGRSIFMNFTRSFK